LVHFSFSFFIVRRGAFQEHPQTVPSISTHSLQVFDGEGRHAHIRTEEEAKRRADLEKQARFAAWNRRRLKPRVAEDLRLLRLLYWVPPTAADPENALYHPLRDAKPANDGNLYPYNSKIRPPPLWIDEDGIEIADLPKIVYSDPRFWPYTGQREVPPPVVPHSFIPPPEEAGSSHDRRDDGDPPSACNPSQQPVPVAAPRSK
jgi:hypothetical protein